MVSPGIVQHKLYTNAPPTKEETAIIRTELTSFLARAISLEEKILQLQSKHNELICQKARISAFVESHQALLAPIRRLLPEILQEIFYHCLPTAHNALMSDQEAPLLLGRVCRRWRQIVYSTPKLWASIHIIGSPSTHPSHTLDVARREAISSWLSRSGGLPLSISMIVGERHTMKWYSCPGSRDASNTQAQLYLDLIISHARRWKYVFLSHFYFYWGDILDRLQGSHLPMLQSLHIEVDQPMRRNTEPIDVCQLSRTVSILSAPSLRTISLPILHSRFMELPIPWNKITGLDLGARITGPSGVYQALNSTPNLESCCISVGFHVEENLSLNPLKMMSLTLLKSLQIIVGSCQDTTSCSLLEHLNTPTLRHLSCKRTDNSWPNDQFNNRWPESSYFLTSLCSFLKRLIYPLEELDYEVSDASVLNVLPLVQNLKRLSLKGIEAPVNDPNSTSPSSSSLPMNDFILSRFIPQKVLDLSDLIQISPGADDELPSPLCLCPKLEVFHCINATFSRQSILDFISARTIERRTHDLTHLRRVSISLCHWSVSKPEEDIRFETDIKVLEKETGVLVDLWVTQNPLTPVPTPTPWENMGIDFILEEPGSFGWDRLNYFML